MARNRTISPDFWTMEAVIDCKPMTRLLFIGLWNFADDGGVQPLRPRTIRMQVFPGDEIGSDHIRAMIDELAAQSLVRIYDVDGITYVAIVDWAQMQRVGRRPRLRYPSLPGLQLHLPPGGEGGARSATDGGCLNESADCLRHPPSALRAPSPSGGRAGRPDSSKCSEAEEGLPVSPTSSGAPPDSAALPVGLALLGEGAGALDGVLAAGHGDEGGVVEVAHGDLGSGHVERAHHDLLGGADAHG